MSNWGDWVPFHRRLVQGRKKAIARGVRFVLLELSLEARPTQGVLEFPPEWDTVKAVHDLIGGDRREIKKALTVFQIPDEFGLPTIEIDRDVSHHSLKIIKWEDYAGPKSSTERSQVSRANRGAVSDIKDLTVPNALHRAAATLQAIPIATPTVQYKTEQDRTVEAEAREALRTAAPRSGFRAKDPDVDAVAAAIRAEPKFSSFQHDAADIAFRAVQPTNRKRLAWYLQSVSDAAADTLTEDMPHVRVKRLRTYLANSKAPKFKEPEPEPVRREIVWSPPANPAARIDLSKIGNGGIR